MQLLHSSSKLLFPLLHAPLAAITAVTQPFALLVFSHLSKAMHVPLPTTQASLISS